MDRRPWNRCVYLNGRDQKRACNTRSLQLRVRRAGIHAECYRYGISDVENLCRLNDCRNCCHPLNRRWPLGCGKPGTLRNCDRRNVDLCGRNFALPELCPGNGLNPDYDRRRCSIPPVLSDLRKAFLQRVLPRPGAPGNDSRIRLRLGSPCPRPDNLKRHPAYRSIPRRSLHGRNSNLVYRIPEHRVCRLGNRPDSLPWNLHAHGRSAGQYCRRYQD